MVHIGARLARRFTLLTSEPVDLPNVERFIAHDSRLRHDVRVDVVTALAPSAVRQAAASAARIRDPRLARMLASGRERIDQVSYTYVVTEQPTGMALADLCARRKVPARIAGTIVGEAARALTKASSEGIHHGYLRPSSITVTSTGRVVIAGLGVDGELALQAGVGRGASESTDALDLGRIYLAAITGLSADVATERDLPADLGVRGRKLCVHVINGSGPLTLDAVVRSFAPVDRRRLTDFPALVRRMTLLPTAPLEAASPAAAGMIDVGVDLAARADHAAQETLAEGHADPELRSSLAQVDATTGLGVVPPDQASQQDAADPLQSPLMREALAEHPEVEELLGASELHDLYEFDEMVAVQDINNTTSTWEALLERMHRRWPGSAGITRRLEHAHTRANRSGPIKAAPVLIPLFLIAVIVATFVAVSQLKAPLDVDGEVEPPQSNIYPHFTYTPPPDPSPTPSPTASEAVDGE